jgi:hypothetical protein
LGLLGREEDEQPERGGIVSGRVQTTRPRAPSGAGELVEEGGDEEDSFWAFRSKDMDVAALLAEGVEVKSALSFGVSRRGFN